MGIEVQTCAIPSFLQEIVCKATLGIADVQKLSRWQMAKIVHDLLNPGKVWNLHFGMVGNLNIPDMLDHFQIFHPSFYLISSNPLSLQPVQYAPATVSHGPSSQIVPPPVFCHFVSI